MKKLVALCLVIVFIGSQVSPVFANCVMSDMLCKLGIKFYQEGRYDEALTEFKKALMVEPGYKPALRYIQMLQEVSSDSPDGRDEISREDFSYEQEKTKPANITKTSSLEKSVPVKKKRSAIKNSSLKPSDPAALIQQEFIAEKKSSQPESVVQHKPVAESASSERSGSKLAPLVLSLDDNFSKVLQPINIGKGASFIVVGKNIRRYLVTQPEILMVKQTSPNELLVTGKDVGPTYMHIWDDNDRWTIDWMGIFSTPEGLTYDELMRQGEEKARNFILKYNLDWYSFYGGSKAKDFERSYYSYSHDLGIVGETPYGILDSSVTARKIRTSTEFSSYTIGLTRGHFLTFNDFNIRGLYYSPLFTNLTFPGTTMYGGTIESPIFTSKLRYNVFWGREGGGTFGDLSPGIAKRRDSFLNGINLVFKPNSDQTHAFSYIHGYGKQRPGDLEPNGYDLSSDIGIGRNWRTGYQVGFDSDHIGYFLNGRYTSPKLSFTNQFRDVDKNFRTMIGTPSYMGEMGNLVTMSYRPYEKLSIDSSLDVFRDRLFPAEDDNDRWNEDFNVNTNYRLNSDTAFNGSYIMQNELGRLSQIRYQSPGVGVSRTIKPLRDLYLFVDYHHQDSQNYSAPLSSYYNEKINSGLRFRLINQLFYFYNNEFNWLKERYTGNCSQPNAWESGFDWSNQIANSKFYGTFRLMYRQESGASSTLSFLAGENYVENYSSISYRPNSDSELYGSWRVRKVWPNNRDLDRRIEADFNAGMRLLWDTGVRWDAVGTIDGYVFRDLNSDGLRQRDDPPVEGVRVWLGNDKSAVTDLFGYYRFGGVRGTKANISIDTATLPGGYVVTVPVMQETTIANLGVRRVDFGIISRCEMSGFIFEDTNNDGEFNPKTDKPVRGVILKLEDGRNALSDANGRYSMINLSPGPHTVTVDLKSVPVYYLPKIAVSKKITLFEGVEYFYNVPLKRVQED